MSSLNSLYTIGDGYSDKPFKYVNGYWVSTIGLLGIAQKFPNSAVIHNYLTKPSPLTDDAITMNGHNYTDVIAAVKALYENKTMQEPTYKKFINYFRELYNNGYRDVKPETLIKLSKEMIQINIRPHQIILSTVLGFLDKKIKIENCVFDMYKFNEQYKLSNNFRNFCLLHKSELEKKSWKE